MAVYIFPKSSDVFIVFDHLRVLGINVIELSSDIDEFMLTTDVEIDPEQAIHLNMTLQE